MSRRYYGRNYKKRPCPGCGETSRRPAQVLCHSCEVSLDLGRRQERRVAEMVNSPDMVRIGIGSQFNSYSRANGRGIGALRDTDAIIAIARIGQLQSTSRFESIDQRLYCWDTQYRSGSVYHAVWATAEQAEAIKILLDFIHAECKSFWDNGFYWGRSLLRELAESGADALNKITVEARRE